MPVSYSAPQWGLQQTAGPQVQAQGPQECSCEVKLEELRAELQELRAELRELRSSDSREEHCAAMRKMQEQLDDKRHEMQQDARLQAVESRQAMHDTILSRRS